MADFTVLLLILPHTDAQTDDRCCTENEIGEAFNPIHTTRPNATKQFCRIWSGGVNRALDELTEAVTKAAVLTSAEVAVYLCFLRMTSRHADARVNTVRVGLNDGSECGLRMIPIKLISTPIILQWQQSVICRRLHLRLDSVTAGECTCTTAT